MTSDLLQQQWRLEPLGALEVEADKIDKMGQKATCATTLLHIAPFLRQYKTQFFFKSIKKTSSQSLVDVSAKQ